METDIQIGVSFVFRLLIHVTGVETVDFLKVIGR